MHVRTGRITCMVTVGLCGTFHGIPQCHMVQMGWDGQVGLPGHYRTMRYVPWNPTVPYGTMGWDGLVGLPGHCRTVWYVPWDPTVPYGTNGMGWTGRIT